MDEPRAMPDPRPQTVLVTGATGYIGSRLVPRLLGAGHAVRCLARSARKLQARPWFDPDRVEIVEADVADEQKVAEALRGCDAAYYLVHSMIVAGDKYRDHDRRLASAFADAARRSGVPRIIYLGGLGETGESLSEHLESRREVEAQLRSSGASVTVLRAAMIIGSGSVSFEILRYLVERLPVMITPRWVSTECQPIAVRNVVHYLVACLGNDETRNRTLDIGGPDVLTYRALMRIMAEERGLRRRFVIPVPVLTPRLSSLWIHLVTPIESSIARPLAEGLRNRVVCRDDEAARLMPQHLLTVREAIGAALGKHETDTIESSWSDAGPMPGDPDWSGGTSYTDRRVLEIDARPSEVFEAVCRMGGGQGYYGASWLWALRGWMDRLVGGPGLRRGRRSGTEVRYGDALDFWRVTGVQRPEYLELRAEMKLPGVASLRFDIEPLEGHRSMLVQTAQFKPKGLIGIAYWYGVVPLHNIVFGGMMKGIAHEARRLRETPSTASAGT